MQIRYLFSSLQYIAECQTSCFSTYQKLPIFDILTKRNKDYHKMHKLCFVLYTDYNYYWFLTFCKTPSGCWHHILVLNTFIIIVIIIIISCLQNSSCLGPLNSSCDTCWSPSASWLSNIPWITSSTVSLSCMPPRPCLRKKASIWK